MVRIREVGLEDADKLAQIYAPYVTDTAITFEYEAPDKAEFEHRIQETTKKYPWLIAENDDGEVIGYAYVSAFKGRAAYDWSVETSIYVKQNGHNQGTGRLLYIELEKILKDMGITNVNACIACTDHEDPHLDNGSVAFHERLGYTLVGIFHKCAYKFGRWYDMCWMEKAISDHDKVKPVRWHNIEL